MNNFEEALALALAGNAEFIKLVREDNADFNTRIGAAVAEEINRAIKVLHALDSK